MAVWEQRTAPSRFLVSGDEVAGPHQLVGTVVDPVSSNEPLHHITAGIGQECPKIPSATTPSTVLDGRLDGVRNTAR